MKKKKPTHTPRTNANLKDSKYIILLLLKEGKNRKQIEETVKLSKPTVLGHIRDLKNKGLVEKYGVYYYRVTPLGYEITHEEFNKMFYRAGGRGFAVEITDKRKRFHNLFYVSHIVNSPEKLPSKAQKNTNLRNSDYYTIQYKEGYIRVHTQKIVLQVDDFTASNAFDGTLQVHEKLRKIIKEAEEDGFYFDSVFIPVGFHIADMWHPLASMYKTKGHQVIIEDRLIIDFSHGVPEFETISRDTAGEDMQIMETIHKAYLDSPKQNAELFSMMYRNLPLLFDNIKNGTTTNRNTKL